MCLQPRDRPLFKLVALVARMLAALFSKFPPTEEQSSSPVGKMNKHFAEHKRDEVQAFGYDEDDDQLESITHFMDFLKVPANRLPSTTPKANNNRLTFKNFIPAANSMARSIKSRCECLRPLFSAFLPTFNPM